MARHNIGGVRVDEIKDVGIMQTAAHIIGLLVVLCVFPLLTSLAVHSMPIRPSDIKEEKVLWPTTPDPEVEYEVASPGNHPDVLRAGDNSDTKSQARENMGTLANEHEVVASSDPGYLPSAGHLLVDGLRHDNTSSYEVVAPAVDDSVELESLDDLNDKENDNTVLVEDHGVVKEEYENKVADQSLDGIENGELPIMKTSDKDHGNNHEEIGGSQTIEKKDDIEESDDMLDDNVGGENDNTVSRQWDTSNKESSISEKPIKGVVEINGKDDVSNQDNMIKASHVTDTGSWIQSTRTTPPNDNDAGETEESVGSLTDGDEEKSLAAQLYEDNNDDDDDTNNGNMNIKGDGGYSDGGGGNDDDELDSGTIIFTDSSEVTNTGSENSQRRADSKTLVAKFDDEIDKNTLSEDLHGKIKVLHTINIRDAKTTANPKNNSIKLGNITSKVGGPTTVNFTTITQSTTEIVKSTESTSPKPADTTTKSEVTTPQLGNIHNSAQFSTVSSTATPSLSAEIRPTTGPKQSRSVNEVDPYYPEGEDVETLLESDAYVRHGIRKRDVTVSESSSNSNDGMSDYNFEDQLVNQGSTAYSYKEEDTGEDSSRLSAEDRHDTSTVSSPTTPDMEGLVMKDMKQLAQDLHALLEKTKSPTDSPHAEMNISHLPPNGDHSCSFSATLPSLAGTFYSFDGLHVDALNKQPYSELGYTLKLMGNEMRRNNLEKSVEFYFPNPVIITKIIIKNSKGDPSKRIRENDRHLVSAFTLQIQDQNKVWHWLKGKPDELKIYQIDPTLDKMEGSFPVAIHKQFLASGLRIYPQDWIGSPTLRIAFEGCEKKT